MLKTENLDEMLPTLARPVERLKLQVSSCRDAGCTPSWPVPGFPPGQCFSDSDEE